jgi:flagellar hook assembly protein FlgD
LQQGTNKLVVKAWDSYNNSSESMLEFVVASSEKMAIKNILNYPNPFTTQTTFHFDHNKAGQPLTVLVQVFTVSGKLVKTLGADVINPGNHFDNLIWDGKDDYGDSIGKGVYVYKVKVKTSIGETAEAIQKLVILN